MIIRQYLYFFAADIRWWTQIQIFFHPEHHVYPV